MKRIWIEPDAPVQTLSDLNHLVERALQTVGAKSDYRIKIKSKKGKVKKLRLTRAYNGE